MKRMIQLWQYIKGQRLTLLYSMIATALSTYFMIQIPFVLKFTFDSVIGTEVPDVSKTLTKLLLNIGDLGFYKSNLWMLGVVLIGFTLLRGLFSFVKGHFSAIGAETVANNLRERMFKHIQTLSYEYHVKVETGDLVQRCTSDVDTIKRFIGSQVVEIGGILFLLAMIITSMFNMNLQMTFASIFILPFAAGFSIYFFNRINVVFKDVDEQEGRLSTLIQENLSGVRVVRAFGRQAHEINRFNEQNEAYSDKILLLVKEFAKFWASQDLIILTQTGFMIFFGVYFTLTGTITLGTFVAFTLLTGYLLWPIRTMGRVLSEMSKSFVSIDRIEAVLSEPSEFFVDGLSPQLSGDIIFEDVHFRYSGSDREILKKIDLCIRQGETLAILGPTGAGKSTLIHLLARFYEPTQGTITIGENLIQTIDKYHLRKHIAVVLQEPFLFAKNISENIKIARNVATQEDVENVAKVAQIHENIMTFDRGYETMVGEKGVSLSGGQKQRVAIARKLITEAPVLVFDDSLSAVDTETDAAIRQRLRNHNNGLTTIIVSHRISTLSAADHIIVLEDGQITQEGTHDQLIEREGLYRKVYEIQDAGMIQRIS